MCIQTYASLKYQYQTDMLFSAKRLILRFIFLKQGVYLAPYVERSVYGTVCNR